MQGQASRVALYWTPHRDDPLWAAGTRWLGRDAEVGARTQQPDLAGIADVTAAPRLYGFHATLRPPMRLATGWEEFMAAAASVAVRRAAFALPRLEVTALGGFLALCAADACSELQRLADCCLQATDPHRLRPDRAEIATRRAGGLSAAEDALLLRWGYPYVLERWRFHMTLTRRLSETEMKAIRPEAERHFAPALSLARRVADIAVFTQAASTDEPSPFLIGERLPLLG